MEVSEQTQSSSSQNPSPFHNEIQLSNLQSMDGIAPVDQLNKNPNPEAEPHQEEKSVSEEPITADEEVHPLNLSSDGRDCIDSNKRKIPEEEKGPLHPLWKTSLCSFFRRQSGSCDHGENCRYAHGEAELRPRPDNSWDPTSERAKKLLKSDAGERIETIPEEAREDVIPFMLDGADPTDAGLSKCLVHLPRKWNSENLKKFLETNGILYKTAKKKKGMTVGFVGFETEEQMYTATEELEGKSMGNKHLRVANVIPRSYEKRSNMATVPDKRSSQPTEHHSGGEDPTMSPSSTAVEDEVTVEKDSSVVDGVATKARSVCDVVTPLAHMPYSNQLEHKKNSLAQTLKRLTRNARKACPDGVPLPEWINKSRDIGGLPCKLEGILESPQVDGYRNKCEFSVGYSLQGKRTVGFMLGNFREGMTAVEEAVSCPNVSSISCKYALIFQEFLQSSTLPVWNRLDNTGFWRQFTVREGRSLSHGGEIENFGAKIAEVMLIVQVCLSGVDSELVMAEFQRMAEALAHGASTCSPPLPLTALIVQDHKGISNAAPSDCPLLPLPIPKVENFLKKDGPNAVETRIHDYISNLRFSISPTAFFQVNTLAAEKLYSLAGDWAGLEPHTLLFDICCGTGTIGLTLAHRVGMVVGVEMNASAISDAKRNAEINGIKNCRYVCAKAEDVMSSLLREYLSMPQQQDETLPDSEGDNKEDVGDRENATHNDKVLRPDSCASNINASAKDETVEKMSDCLACGSNGSLEVTQVLKEEVGPIDTMKESNVNASTPGESSRHRMADDKRTTTIQQSSLGEFKDLSQKHCISEENETSAMTLQQFKDVVAIVDPPRVGLHPTVIKALRTHPRLRRLVYISCNPESLVANAIELCTPSPDKPNKGKNNRGWRNMSSAGLARHRAKSMPNSEPFRPVKAMAVDLFPHTPHCEMVMLLER